MELSVTTLGWLGLGGVLFYSSFVSSVAFWLIINLLGFFIGAVGMLYYYGSKKSEIWRKEQESMVMPSPSIGIPKVVDDMRKEKPKLKIDKRMTGSNLIDDVLYEVLDYTYRDFIHVWYRKISDDNQFQYDIRQTMQKVVIATSERAKEVDLVPYLTTKLVDDFASHIRLYRRALTKNREHQNDDTKPPADLESIFFDLETEMEDNMCRDMICTSEEREIEYLQDVTEVLLFLMLPPEDFHNKPFRYLVREIIVNEVFLQCVNIFSDPDYINQTISWLTKDAMFNNESFLTVLKTSDNVDELQATKEKVDLDIARQRSKDTGGDDDSDIKQQLNSLLYVKSVCEARITRLQDGTDEPDYGLDIHKLMVPGQKLYSLPFDVVLNNNVALAYFIEFMTNIGAQHYLFFYLTVEGYRVSAEQQISAALLAGPSTGPGEEKPDLEMLRDAAISIYNQYISEKASPRVKCDEHTMMRIWEEIQRKDPSEGVFDHIQAKVWDMLQDNAKYFPAFKKSQIYIRLLAELDLLKDSADPMDDPEQDDLVSAGDSSKSSSLQASRENLGSSCESVSSTEASAASGGPRQPASNFTFTAKITSTGVCREHGKAYAVYMVTVTKHNPGGEDQAWDVYRRYSDFHDLHTIIQEKYESLSAGLALPSKKTFNNMNKDFLEKRKNGLNAYLQTILSPSVLNSHRGLVDLVYQFLEHIVWEKGRSELSKKVDTVVNPLRTSVKSVGNFVKSVPDNFVDGIAKMSGGIKSIPSDMLQGVGKILNVRGTRDLPSLPRIPSLLVNFITAQIKSRRSLEAPPPKPVPTISVPEPDFEREYPKLEPPGSPGDLKRLERMDLIDSGKVGAGLGAEEEDNIPLRIMLLLMDEVFDLKNRNQWLRRRIVAILRQIIKTMYGDNLNRKIVENVERMTSAEQIAEFIKIFKENFWPNGTLAEPKPPRENNTKMRTRVVAKAKMLGTIDDELKNFLGSETTRHGVTRTFNMFQHPTLNRRLVYVIFEGMLQTIFPDNKFNEVFRKIHSRSPRVKKVDVKSQQPKAFGSPAFTL